MQFNMDMTFISSLPEFWDFILLGKDLFRGKPKALLNDSQLSYTTSLWTAFRWGFPHCSRGSQLKIQGMVYGSELSGSIFLATFWTPKQSWWLSLAFTYEDLVTVTRTSTAVLALEQGSKRTKDLQQSSERERERERESL